MLWHTSKAEGEENPMTKIIIGINPNTMMEVRLPREVPGGLDSPNEMDIQDAPVIHPGRLLSRALHEYIMKTSKAQRKYGPPPAGTLERLLQKALRELQGEEERD